MKDGQRPGPATYEPLDSLSRSKVEVHSTGKAVRMPADRYHTDAPGAGTYRMQSNFGVYSASDTFNHFEVRSL